MLILGWVLCFVWLLGAVPAMAVLYLRRLQKGNAQYATDAHWPLVSVILAARDEGAEIAGCLQSLVDSDYPNLEIIAVNDRSRDVTGEIMDGFQDSATNVRVFHLTELPEGWLGKNHALDFATKQAQGELLLFTDGDIKFEVEAIGCAVRYLQSQEIDHLCLMPAMAAGGYWEQAFVSFFGMLFCMGTQPWLASTRFNRAYVGVGAFNMIRRSVYDAVGGHEPIRLDVLDDVKLGKLVKKSGYRQELLRADELISLRWQPSAWGVITGLEKNGFASLNYSWLQLLLVTVLGSIVFFAPFYGATLLPSPVGYGHACALLVAHLGYGFMGRMSGAGWRIMPAFAVAALAMLFAFWRSAWKIFRQGGVVWRDTFYPLALLRKHLYQ